MKSNPDFKKVAIRAAREAGKILKKHFGKIDKVFLKKDSSLVTVADREAEKTIINLLRKNFPSHSILSEESGGKIGKEYAWVIDPLDGTRNYTIGIPFFCVSIALCYKENPVLAVILNPITKELYFAERGKGSFLNGSRIKVRKFRPLKESIILLNLGKKGFIKLDKLDKACHRLRVFGAAALELCCIAAAKGDGLIAMGNKPWDYAAGVLIIKEAGGKVTDLKGRDWDINTKSVIAGNKEIHEQLLKIVK